MVTKRKLVKVRDGEQTQKELLEAVGRILSEQGFRGLKTNEIARHVGKDKNLVRYYFENLAGLEKAYINEKDYWPPFFERFRIDGTSTKADIEKLFTELMQENFRFFLGNPEMQQIILWQISEANPLLKHISEQREIEGAKLLELTDPYFNDTGISFRTILALLLGGIYYLVLHAKYNKSTVSGIDVNRAEDRAALLKTVGQVLSWAWQAAENKETK
jgi:AcrR family transcriptional regulator